MTTIGQRLEAATQGHVAVYARDIRWRRAVAKSLREAGHSMGHAATPRELHRLLAGQRFDLLALKVRDEAEAREIAGVLQEVRLPLHTILLGSASALPLTLQRRRGGTFRYVPGSLPPADLSRLVDVSIISGGWDEAPSENGHAATLEEVELEEIIDRAANAVSGQAGRKQQRFHSAVVGPATHAFADRAKLLQALTALLRLIVALAPSRALISVDAQAGREEWLLRISSGNGKQASRTQRQTTHALCDEAKTLTAVSRVLKEQSGMLWVELKGSGALTFALTLPLPPEAASRATA